MEEQKVKLEDVEEVQMPDHIHAIRNKTIRKSVLDKAKRDKIKLKKAEKKKRKKMDPKDRPKSSGQKTIDNMREKDDTILDPLNEDNKERIEEMNLDLKTDEYENYFNKEYEPKVLITFKDNPLPKTRIFGLELCRVIPNSMFLYRNRCSIKKMVKTAIPRGFTDILIINEDRGRPNALLLVHLPDGPTAYFRLSNVKTTNQLFKKKKSWKEISRHRPELILNNFTTRLGQSVARMFNGVFHYSPEFKGRRVVTFHNQRDYIFFRHHRYEFSPKTAKPRLKELGPRFTMRLQSLQRGAFDSKCGEYEWIQTGRRHEIETSRRRFFL